MYKEMYYCLFNAISDAIEKIEMMDFGSAAELLRQAQAKAEDAFISSDEDGDLPEPEER